MLISFYGTSNRPYFWKRAYESMLDAKLDFEFVFSGPEKPSNWKLPSNFRWIKTNVKPSQGQHIAYLESQGDYILCVSDDGVGESWEREKGGFLDVLFYYWQQECDGVGHDKVVMAPKFKDGHRTFSSPFIRSGECRGPNTCLVAGLMKRSFMDEVGGFDKRFLGPFAQIDVAMELWARGGHLAKVRHAVFREPIHKALRICPALNYHDRPLLNSFWMREPEPGEEVPGDKSWGYFQTPNIVLSKERTQSWQHFEKENILEKSQGANIDTYGWD